MQEMSIGYYFLQLQDKIALYKLTTSLSYLNSFSDLQACHSSYDYDSSTHEMSNDTFKRLVYHFKQIVHVLYVVAIKSVCIRWKALCKSQRMNEHQSNAQCPLPTHHVSGTTVNMHITHNSMHKM